VSVKNLLAVALGIMSAIGGFVDIGDLVFNTQAGAIFGFQLLWVVVIGVAGIIVYSEMCGRVSAVAQRPVFDLVRERTGFGAGLATLIASEVVNLMTCAAEIGGVAICLQLLSGLPYRVLILLAVVGLAVCSWVLPFEWIERVFGYMGLCLLVFAVARLAIWWFPTDVNRLRPTRTGRVRIVLAGVAYQLFLRYTYVHTVGNTVVRVDRVSGASAIFRCASFGGAMARPSPMVAAM